MMVVDSLIFEICMWNVTEIEGICVMIVFRNTGRSRRGNGYGSKRNLWWWRRLWRNKSNREIKTSRVKRKSQSLETYHDF